ncbi:FliM/FliN family flagellar motor switch protein [Methylobrevis pamukkalensis]|uniref:Flagellar motor switch protein FliN n=1 Tax=Methylobrevis pamukkalensis TaxID=1439726 RepID=A0A1E3H7I7_9HYPH|nr:FliM/FliN family flagellar motor switch protein [Methylobrevis pamukkalensis]ODN71736.1 Flagellar motor switch protein FliN [Methylobrevis pamukkalensis]
MSTLDKITVEIAVVLGSSTMPVHQLLRMGRGAVIELDTGADDDVDIYANDIHIARGQVILKGERVSIQITEILKRNPLMRMAPTVKKV